MDVCHVYEVLLPQPIHPLPQAPSFLEGVISLKGRIIAVLDLAKKFRMKSGPKESQRRFIICRVNKFIVGLLVDQVREVILLNVDFVTPGSEILTVSSSGIPFAGVARFGERVIPILDPEKILSEEESVKLSQSV